MNPGKRKPADFEPWTYEYQTYVTQNPIALEVVPWYLFHRKRIHDPFRTEFFTDVFYRDLGNDKDEDNNMLMSGMLPNPCAYLIEGMRIFGLPSLLINARVSMVIGNKIMMDTAAIAYVERWKQRDKAIMIPPMYAFRVSLTWKNPPLGIELMEHKPLVTIMFKGQMARAIQ